jgi:uncharacterized protein YaaN involved in tellurite resistance
MDTNVKAEQDLTLFSLEQAEKKLSAIEVQESQAERYTEQANALIDDLFSKTHDDLQAQQSFAKEVQDLGGSVQRKLVHKSNLLREPMSVLMSDLQDGGSIAQSMIDLQHQISQIDPNRFNFKMSGFRRLLSKLPGVGTVLSNWLVRFESVQAVINDIVESLKIGRKRLDRDNITLQTDKQEMYSLAQQLQEYVIYGQAIDAQLAARIDKEIDDHKHKQFLQKEVLFPLRQRIIDLQQQQAVNQYGMVTAESIIQNNKEIMRGVERSLNVTVVAFQTASTLSIALEHQKKVLKGVQAINDTTNDLLLRTSEKLRDQGVQIQQQSASASIDTQVLQQSFKNVYEALEQVNSFRVKALPQMSESIEKMNRVNKEMDSVIQDMHQANDISKSFQLSE